MTRAKRRAGVPKLDATIQLKQPLSEKEVQKPSSPDSLQTPNPTTKLTAEQIGSQRLLASHSTATMPFIKALEPADMATRMIKVRPAFKQPLDPYLLKVAILGAANAGKSTLMNQIVGEQISVVSPKAHTTRDRVLAVYSQDNKQIVFLDTPGVIPGRNHARLNRELVNASWHALEEADHLVVVVDVAKVLYAPRTFSDDYLFERLQQYSIPATLLVNKMDLLTNKEVAESVANKFNKKYPYFKKTLFVSALEKEDLAEIKDVLLAEALPRDWLFPADQTGEMSDLRRVEDCIRVEFFKRLHQYLPYILKQENIGWTDLPGSALRIDQTVYVERDSQKKIVVGTNGAVINEVVIDATREISKALRRSVKLFIQVKSRRR